MRSDHLPIVWIRHVHCTVFVAALLLALLPQIVAAAKIGTLEQTSGGLEPAAPTPSQPTGTAADWTGNYYATQDLSGDPVLTRQDGAIDFDWQAGSPDASVSSDSFSVSWTATSTFEAGSYRFSARVDDGVRIYVDDSLLLEDWNLHPATTTVSDTELTAGSHTVKVEYFEADGMASITVWWEKLEEDTPDCEIQPHDSLSSFWDHSALGCASAAAQTVWSAWQPFESGHMIWRQDGDDYLFMRTMEIGPSSRTNGTTRLSPTIEARRPPAYSLPCADSAISGKRMMMYTPTWVGPRPRKRDFALGSNNLRRASC